MMSQNGQIQFENLAALAPKILKCTLRFWDVMHYVLKESLFIIPVTLLQLLIILLIYINLIQVLNLKLILGVSGQQQMVSCHQPLMKVNFHGHVSEKKKIPMASVIGSGLINTFYWKVDLLFSFKLLFSRKSEYFSSLTFEKGDVSSLNILGTDFILVVKPLT